MLGIYPTCLDLLEQYEIQLVSKSQDSANAGSSNGTMMLRRTKAAGTIGFGWWLCLKLASREPFPIDYLSWLIASKMLQLLYLNVNLDSETKLWSRKGDKGWDRSKTSGQLGRTSGNSEGKLSIGRVGEARSPDVRELKGHLEDGWEGDGIHPARTEEQESSDYLELLMVLQSLSELFGKRVRITAK